MDNLDQTTVETGVNEAPAAEVQAVEIQTTETQTQTQTGVESNNAAAEHEDGAEKAFAAKLAKERQKFEQQQREAVARAQQEARDAYIAEQGYTWNGKAITTEAEYRAALREQEIRNQGIDPELVNQMVSDHPDVRAARESLKRAQEQEKIAADVATFSEKYPDVKPEDIPIEVLQEANQPGKSLVDAYAKYENQQLKTELTKLRETLQIREQNAANAQASTGSVTGQGNIQPVQFTRAQVEKMSAAEVSQNWKAIMESQKHWK